MPEHAPSALLGAAITPDPTTGPLLVAHLGGPKTGSSAIQAFCDHNRTALFRQYGILYPTLNPDRVPDAAFPDIPGDPNFVLPHHGAIIMGMEPDAQDDYLDRAVAVCRATNTPILLLSLEAPSLPDYADMVRRHTERTGLRAVAMCYVRRQDTWIEDAWKQWGLKYDQYPTPDDFARALMDRELDDVFFRAAVSVLEHAWLDEVWGFTDPADMVVRPYERSVLQCGDVVADLLGLLGVGSIAHLPLPPATNFNTNHGFTPEAIKLLRTVRPMFDGIYDNGPYAMLYDALPGAAAAPFAHVGLLSPGMRAAVLAHYAPHNERLARRMPAPHGHGDGMLFREAPDPDAPWWPDRELTMQEVATMLMQCVQRQHVRIGALEERLEQLERRERKE
ncbi:hypothetical protein [Nitratidesulfovibrio sp. SRB-5]|uniref:hypothetical protein n=1 Tax=Nitratidesulfovibrio sp. SRB-5 TaxID=2872636 RepID=UPI001027346E|nr:hypothetical protein [Nitratidesulfovibrio sp. SRB-5]MBZ2172237.1 hypothetical protein [Nitratidesulfovibrio sp. SRB-5]RXF77198.1 hypothetical protein EKK70_07625 [Desulfovibrio sp. DS-1]